MPETGLNVAPGLVLPLDAITQSIALLAVRRAGKSNAAAVMAEEMHHAGLPWVAIDPKGDWWGLRSSSDGKGDGLPVPIFGGLHGDMPLVPEAGPLIAELIVSENLTCVLDVSEFASKAAQMRFLTDLGERLFRLHGKHPTPRHVFLEEADDVIPQSPRSDMARCVGAWTKLIKQGGSRGLGITIISQRSAVVSKDALTQTGTMIALRTTSPQDRKAIMGWVDYHAVAREIVDSLPGLDDGEAWVCSPHWLARHGQPAIQRVRFRQRATFDSGATPTLKQAQRPATLADIDLTALTGRMEAVVEKAAADDPKALRRKIADLERQLRGPGGAGEVQRYARMAESLQAENADLRRQLADAQAREPERVEVPVLQPGEIAALEQSIAAMKDVTAPLELALTRAAKAATAPVPARPVPAPRAPVPPPAVREQISEPAPGEPPQAEDIDRGKLGKAERTVLAVLAQFPDGRTRQQLAVLSGYSPSSLRNPLGRLRTLALAGKGDPIMITDAGRDVIGDDYEPLPVGQALVDHWMSVLGKAERTVLGILLDAWPDPVGRAELAERSGYSETSLRNPLGRLRTLDLVHDWTADETLAQHARGSIHA